MSKATPRSGGRDESSPRSRKDRGHSTRRRSARGTGVRRRGRQMDTVLAMLVAINQLGARSREFGTVDVQEATGMSYSQTYGWLHAFKTRGFVTGRLDTERRAIGDWRWRRRLRLVVADGEA